VGVPGSTYSLQCSTNLATNPFATIESGIPAVEATNTVVTVKPGGTAFYRVILE
jgi:hypothetical protein